MTDMLDSSEKCRHSRERRRSGPPSAGADQHHCFPFRLRVNQADMPGCLIFISFTEQPVFPGPDNNDVIKKQMDVSAHESPLLKRCSRHRRLFSAVYGFSKSAGLQRPALQEVDPEASVFREIRREFDIDRVVIRGGQRCEHIAHHAGNSVLPSSFLKSGSAVFFRRIAQFPQPFAV